MHIGLDLSNLLEAIAIVVSFGCLKIDLDSKKFGKIISKSLAAFSGVYLVLGVFGLDNYCVMMVLRFLQKGYIGICLYILLFALIPPAVASWERKKKIKIRMEKSYIKWNRIFNLLGALSACGMFVIAHDIVGDFSYLKEFLIEGIVSVLIPVCVGLVLSYQSIEQHNKLPDHLAGTKWLNQKLNMLHLFHAIFFSAISAVLIVCYSIYCYIHNVQLTIRPNYFFFLTLALIFFYSLSQHFHKHVYIVFLVMVPVILVSSVYWMSWFSMSNGMRCGQWIFIVLHSLTYAFFIIYRNKMIFIGKREELKDKRYGKPHKFIGNRVCAIERSGFQAILLLIVIVCYSISWLVPILTQRIEGGEAENYITEICVDTDINADEMIALAKEQCAYDAINEDFDRGKYLEFIYKELYEQILDKGIINEDSRFLKYDELWHWYVNTH